MAKPPTHNRTKCFVPRHFVVLLGKAGNYYAFNIEAFKTLALSNRVMRVSQSSEVSMLRSDHFPSLAFGEAQRAA